MWCQRAEYLSVAYAGILEKGRRWIAAAFIEPVFEGKQSSTHFLGVDARHDVVE